MVKFDNNVAYTFSAYPPTIATKFRNVIVQGTLTYQLARPMADLQALHALYYPSLPPGTPDDPTVFEYLVVKLDSGLDTVISTAWIKEETVVRADAFPMQVMLPNVSPTDIGRIRDMLTVNGFTGYRITNAKTHEEL